MIYHNCGIKNSKEQKTYFIKSKGNHSNQTSGNNLKVRKVDKKGRFKAKTRKKSGKKSSNIIVEHNYADILSICKCRTPKETCTQNCPVFSHRKQTNGFLERWHGRRVIERDVLLIYLQYCQHYRLGPVPLTYDNVVGELQKGLGGYLHVMCLNVECGAVNKVPYDSPYEKKECHVLTSTQGLE